MLHRFGHMGTPTYHGRLYREFRHGHCEVLVLAHPFNLGMMAWFTTATGDDTLERAAHQTITEFCERHLPGLAGTAIALFPIQNEGNTA
jgi:hypothetical protein